jgi:hypothetical protein
MHLGLFQIQIRCLIQMLPSVLSDEFQAVKEEFRGGFVQA